MLKTVKKNVTKDIYNVAKNNISNKRCSSEKSRFPQKYHAARLFSTSIIIRNVSYYYDF